MLPNVKRLKLDLHTNCDLQFINCELCHLEHLHLIVNGPVKRDDQIEEFLKKNKQIQSIEIDRYPAYYVDVIARILPNIYILTIHMLDIQNELTGFECVKHLTLFSVSVDSIARLSFPNLESLKLQYSPALVGVWIEFFKKHRTLKRLHLIEHFTGMKMQLLKITDELPNLMELSIECTSQVGAQTIEKCIENHGNLQKFQFAILNFKEEDAKRLKRRFENEWRLQEFTHASKWKGLQFERQF